MLPFVCSSSLDLKSNSFQDKKSRHKLTRTKISNTFQYLVLPPPRCAHPLRGQRRRGDSDRGWGTIRIIAVMRPGRGESVRERAHEQAVGARASCAPLLVSPRAQALAHRRTAGARGRGRLLAEHSVSKRLCTPVSERARECASRRTLAAGERSRDPLHACTRS